MTASEGSDGLRGRTLELFLSNTMLWRAACSATVLVRLIRRRSVQVQRAGMRDESVCEHLSEHATHTRAKGGRR